MSQQKNSQSSIENRAKRELTIAIRVLEGQLETVEDCLEEGDPTGKLYTLEYSLQNSIDYLKDLRNDMNNKEDK